MFASLNNEGRLSWGVIIKVPKFFIVWKIRRKNFQVEKVSFLSICNLVRPLVRQSGCQPEIWPILWRRWVDSNFMAADFLDKQLLVVWYIAQTATSPYFANYFWEIEPCFIFAFFSIFYLSSHTPSISISVRGCMAIANGWKSPGSIHSEFLPCAVHIMRTQGVVSQQKSNTHFRPSILPDDYLADVREHVMSQVFPSCQKSELEIKPFRWELFLSAPTFFGRRQCGRGQPIIWGNCIGIANKIL